MTRIDEGRASVSFGPSWTASKWDDEAAFEHGIKRVVGHRAVDIAAAAGGIVALVELKDYANPSMPAANRLRLLRTFSTDRLAREIAQKVADSLSGVSWSHPRRGSRSAAVEHVSTAMRVTGIRLAVIVVAEHETALAPEIGALAVKLRRELDWLPPSTTVVVTDSAQAWPLPDSGLTVT